MVLYSPTQPDIPDCTPCHAASPKIPYLTSPSLNLLPLTPAPGHSYTLCLCPTQPGGRQHCIPLRWTLSSHHREVMSRTKHHHMAGAGAGKELTDSSLRGSELHSCLDTKYYFSAQSVHWHLNFWARCFFIIFILKTALFFYPDFMDRHL